MKRKVITFLITTVITLTTSVNAFAYDFMYEDDVYSMVCEIAGPYQVSPEMVMGVIWKESRFATDAISSEGCIGLMQINPKSQKHRMEKLGVDDLYNPYMNIQVGIDLLAELYEEYEDNSYVLDLYRGARNAKSNFEKGIDSSYSKSVENKALEFEERYTK